MFDSVCRIAWRYLRAAQRALLRVARHGYFFTVYACHVTTARAHTPHTRSFMVSSIHALPRVLLLHIAYVQLPPITFSTGMRAFSGYGWRRRYNVCLLGGL